MLKSLAIISGAALVVAAYVIAQPKDSRANTPAPAAVVQQPQDAKAAGSQAMSSAQDFLKTAAQDNQAEIELAQLAQSKAASAEVKQFAQMLITDHQKANQEVTKIAKAQNVMLPTGLSATQESTKDALSGLSGAAFDHAYISGMVGGHEKAVEMFRDATSSPNEDVRIFAETTLPTLRHHLEEAQRIQKTLGGGDSAPDTKAPGSK